MEIAASTAEEGGALIDLGRGLEAVLDQINRFRRSGDASPELSAAEEILDRIFETSSHLAVYGSLAPGAPNHSVISQVTGRWLEGSVRGVLHPEGWGAAQGFPALRCDPDGPAVAVKLLVSEHLKDHWDRLDDFEGPGYRRSLVPVRKGDQLLAVANIYVSVTGDEIA